MIDEDKHLWNFYETENRQSFLLSRPRLDFIAKRIVSHGKSVNVLDIGIGDGYLLARLSSRFNVHGLDISPANVERTKKDFSANKIRATLRTGSIDDIPFQDNEFDFVVASDVLEHLDKDVFGKALTEIYRILKKGGLFIGTVPADEKLNDNICFCPKCGNVFHRWGHKESFNKAKIEAAFAGKGFHLTKMKRITFYGVQLNEDKLINRVKITVGKLLFYMFKRIFAPQWWLYLEARKGERF
jgi:ubiquinone/menaquinone biosynthesis C-methylase UbiE